MERVSLFRYNRTVLCKHRTVDGEMRERAGKGRQVSGTLERIMKSRNMSMRMKKAIGNSIVHPTLSYASETWTWNAAQQMRLRAVEMSYMRGACGISRWDLEDNEKVYEIFSMSATAKGMDCGVVAWVKKKKKKKKKK